MQQIITHCKEQITAACHVLNTPFKTVKALFQDKEITVIKRSYKTEKDLMMEIRFDTATLSCLFDQNKLCDGVFLFPDESTNILHYIEYCSQTYSYHYLLQGWLTNNCCIQIHSEDNEYNLIVLPIKPTKS